MNARVRPKDAASLVLVRHGPQGVEVLLGRRAGRHRFLPDVYAFPGGRVDPEDRPPTLHNQLLQNGNFCHFDLACEPRLAPAFALAAIRETWEETGIALGQVVDGKLQPDCSGLRYLCRAITPAESPIRFHARFFLQDVTGRDLTLAGSGELLDLGFRPLENALGLPLADITEFVLHEVRRLGPDLVPKETAFWRYRRGKPMIRWSKPAVS